MAQEDKRKEHYIPRFYLRRFSIDKKCIYRYDISSGEQKSVPIRTICYENDLYEFKNDNGEYVYRNLLENIFGEYEVEFSKVFNNIESKAKIKANYYTNCFLSHIEKVLLRFFISTTIIRNPDTLKAAYETAIELYGDNITEISAKNKALEYCLPIYRELSLDEKNILITFTKLLQNMSFQIGFTEKDAIWTSDNPVVLYGEQQPAKIEEVILALSPNLVLYMKPYEKTKKGCYNRLVELESKDIRLFNRDIIKNCKRWIYSQKTLTENQIKWIIKERGKL